MSVEQTVIRLPVEELRYEIKKEYADIALNPDSGEHFHIGRRQAEFLGYEASLYTDLPEGSVASFAGTGNPFAVGQIHPGEIVVDVGCGAGFDSLIAARFVGPTGRVIGIDMTPEMLAVARAGTAALRLVNVEFRDGYAEALPLPDNFAEVVISNGVLNLTPDKSVTLWEWARLLKPGGRLYVGDVLSGCPLSPDEREDVSLWTG